MNAFPQLITQFLLINILIIKKIILFVILEPILSGAEVFLKVRLSCSTGPDKKLVVNSTDTVSKAKKRLEVSMIRGC